MQGLSESELGRAATVCSSWRDVSRSNAIWAPLLKSAFPGADLLKGVASYQAVYTRLSCGPSTLPALPKGGLKDYQFVFSLKYYGRTVLSTSVQGEDAQSLLSSRRRSHSEDSVVSDDDGDESEESRRTNPN